MILSGGGLELYFNPTTFGVERLSVQGDPEVLSWVRGGNFGLPIGNNFLIKSDFSAGRFTGEFLFFSEMHCTVTVTPRDGAISFLYLFKNDGKHPLTYQEGELGIYLPFNDDFDEPELSLRRRVHAHVRTQGATHVYCERYSGDLPSLGLIMVKGECFSYSLERDARKGARGNILLNLPATELPVGASFECEFLLYPCVGREDFFEKADAYGFPTATASALAVFAGEEITIKSPHGTSLRLPQGDVSFSDGEVTFRAEGSGEQHATVLTECGTISMSYYVIPSDLPAKRASFVLDKQYLAEGPYRGAFTAYDHRTDSRMIRRGVRSPFSLAGFRAAPLLFLLRQAREGKLSEEMLRRVEDSVSFYDREVYRGGEVSDDIGGKRTRLFKRYYNYPLYAAIKYEEYLFTGDIECLMQSGVILCNLYKSGNVYEVDPTVDIVEALRAAGKDPLAEEITDLVAQAADKLISSGNKYAPFKGLPFGPEIVYGSLSTLLDAYRLTGKEYYLMTAKEHLVRLDSFSFPSMHYATDFVPEIFQRDRGSGLFYDMSPHFTAVHFSVIYEKYYRLTGETKYREAAQRILLSSLTLFDETGAGRRSRSACKSVNDFPLPEYEEISYGEDVVLYHFGLLFKRK